MKKLISIFLLTVAGMTFAFAQDSTQQSNSEEREPVTSKWSLYFGGSKYANHWLSPQEYSAPIKGFEAIHGRHFVKSKNLSWQLTLTHLRNKKNILSDGMSNPANTAYISTQNYEVDYAVFYNWVFYDRLQVRLGGSFNLYGGFTKCDESAINNVMSLDFQTQLYAACQIRYGWDFKKFGLDLYANVATPFIGMALVDSRYQSAIEAIAPVKLKAKGDSHLKFSSLHNLQGLNLEIGIGFALRKLTLSASYEINNRWWCMNQLQNYRKNGLLKLGISVKLFSQQNYKTGSRQF